jgi:hypothetical protein
MGSGGACGPGSARRTGLGPESGMAAIIWLCDRLGVIGALDAAVGPVKQA